MKKTLFLIFIYLLPKKFLSKYLGFLANLKLPSFILQPIIRLFMRFYNIPSQSIPQKISSYQTFNQFFTRTLIPDSRTWSKSQQDIISPVDGTILNYGDIKYDTLIQAKGIDFSLEKLLPFKMSSHFINGTYCVIYLSPPDYHRIHSPIQGTIISSSYIPGTLYPVNSLGVNNIPQLFSRNERTVTYIKGKVGLVACVKVAATIVGSIKLTYKKDIQTNKLFAKQQHTSFEQAIPIKKGDQLGEFSFGSTVILLFPSKTIQFSDTIQKYQKVYLGDTIAHYVD